jgi:hypothetical protein
MLREHRTATRRTPVDAPAGDIGRAAVIGAVRYADRVGDDEPSSNACAAARSK